MEMAITMIVKLVASSRVGQAIFRSSALVSRITLLKRFSTATVALVGFTFVANGWSSSGVPYLSALSPHLSYSEG